MAPERTTRGHSEGRFFLVSLHRGPTCSVLLFIREEAASDLHPGHGLGGVDSSRSRKEVRTRI